MNLSKFLPTLLGGLLSVTLANFGFAKDSSEIAWSEDLVATMELAQRTGKPVLVHFYGDHCPPCRMLEKKAFKDPQLIQAIGEHVLAVESMPNGTRKSLHDFESIDGQQTFTSIPMEMRSTGTSAPKIQRLTNEPS